MTNTFTIADAIPETDDWRSRELSLDEVIKKFPDVPPLIVLKTDLHRRGVAFTDAALARVDPSKHAILHRGIYGDKDGSVVSPNGLLLRDGTSVLCDTIATQEIRQWFNRRGRGGREPYLADFVDGRLMITDQGRVLEEAEFWPSPAYCEEQTSGGKPMWQLLVNRPQRMDINIYQNCDFWKEPGMGCRFCAIAATYHQNKDAKPEQLDYGEVVEAVLAAVSQPGRFRMIQFCAGTRLSGGELLDDEVDQYCALFKLLEKHFAGKKIQTQLIATAYTEGQLHRLFDETILSSYTADIEVLDENLFNWICPGKAKYIGYKEWRRRLFKAAEIFGPNAVNTGIVSGIELAAPNGFRSEAEALENYVREAEYFARNGVGIAQTIWGIHPASIFRKQLSPSLEYLVAFARELDIIQRRYHLEMYYDDYRTCGNHPNTDLARI
jgi:hypothetical protein